MKKAATGKKALALYIAIVMILFSLAIPVYAGKITSFSAEQVAISPRGRIEGIQKFYVTPDKMRMEGKSPSAEGRMTMIYRKDRKVFWMINPDKKMYFENALDEQEWGKALKQDIKTENAKDLGTETVNGYKCRKKLVETTVKMFGITQKSRATVWKSDEFDFPLRTKSDDGSITEMRDIKPGRQASGLFVLPKGYTQAPNMFTLFGEPSEDAPQEEKDDKGHTPSFKDITDKLKGFKLPFGGKK